MVESKSNPTDKLYTSISSFVKSATNNLVPSLLNAKPAELPALEFGVVNIKSTGFVNVTISNACTFNDDFYSYRKDKITGRFISLIWFNK